GAACGRGLPSPLRTQGPRPPAHDHGLMRDRGVLTRLLDVGGCACPTMPLSERCAASQSLATTVSLELGEEVVLARLAAEFKPAVTVDD
ncbi:MAG: hypothetical protein WBZ51_27535, partial [Xanthobacteraceae bacterium]